MSIKLQLYTETKWPKEINLGKHTIFILFSTENSVSLGMGPRSFALTQNSNYLFYEKDRDFVFSLKAEEQGPLVIISLPITELHSIVAKGGDSVDFDTTRQFAQGSFHRFESNSAKITECLNTLLTESNPLIQEAKKYELLGYLFTTPDVKTYKCPFLNQSENVQKVRDAKALLIKDLQDAPTIKQLSREVGLNEYNLKTGFKEIYGKPIYQFLKDHRIKEAQKLLDDQQMQVNEIAEHVGYSNVSHFIEAFKKKFGQTPKQYSLNQK